MDTGKPGIITEYMYPCADCVLAIEGPVRFGTEKATAINAEVQRQLSGDSLREASDPTPDRLMRCAAMVAIQMCGNFTVAPQLHLRVSRTPWQNLELGQENPYL